MSPQFVPPLVLDIRNNSLGLVGYLAIDSVINNRSAGGIRILPDVSRSEVVSLARNMTLKFGYWNIPFGGAKSCVLASEAWRRRARDRYLSAFGRIAAPLIKSDKYVIGFDMGTSKIDLERVHAAAGRSVNVRDPKTHIYTAWTILAACKAATEHIGLDLSQCRIAIEGFGKVGSATAELLSDLGASIVAASTSEGAIYSPAGLDVQELLRAREKIGDKLTCEFKAKKIAKRDLLSLPVDILIPCARPWSINLSNVGEIRAKIICPGANVPMSVETQNVLHRNDVLCVPDFLANSGGVLGSYMEPIVGEGRIKAIISIDFVRQMRDILQLSQERNVPPDLIGRTIALHRFDSTKRRAERDIFQKDFVSGLKLPKKLRRILAPLYKTIRKTSMKYWSTRAV